MTLDQHKQIKLENSYLEDYRNVIRGKAIPWDGFARSELITHEQAKRLNELEGATVTHKIDFVVAGEHLHDYLNTLLGLLSKGLPPERSDIKKYALVLVSDLLCHDKFIDGIIKLQQAQPGSVISPFIKHIDSTDEVVKLIALYDVCDILIQDGVAPADPASVSKVFQVLNSLIESTQFSLRLLALELTTELLSIKQYRQIFWEGHADYFQPLINNLKDHMGNNATESVQFQYKILLCIWLLTFSTDSLKDISKSYLTEFLPLLQLAKSSIKEKVVRLIISIFINLTSIPANDALSTENLKFFILVGDILPILNNLKERKWSDEELLEDLDILYSKVQEVYSRLTSFDEYLQELNAKSFKNSPVHSNDEFFIDNLHHFQDNNYKIFKRLISLLDEQLEPKCYVYLLSDLGKILKLDTKAIDVLTKENKKTKIMELLNHKSSEVRYEALKATQFIVSQTFK